MSTHRYHKCYTGSLKLICMIAYFFFSLPCLLYLSCGLSELLACILCTLLFVSSTFGIALHAVLQNLLAAVFAI